MDGLMDRPGGFFEQFPGIRGKLQGRLGELLTLRRSIIVQGGLIRSTGVVLVVLVLVFVVPGVVF